MDAARLRSLLESRSFTVFITALILVNAAILGLETSPAVEEAAGRLLTAADGFILAVFTAEIVLKLVVYRGSFFRSGWNLFDFAIVAVSLIPASGPFSVLRAFRILRVLRLFAVVPQMRRVINALFHAIPGMSSVVGVLLIVFYVAAVLATNLFGESPNEALRVWFGSVGASMYTLFQIMTLESWSMGIVRPTLELYPWAWAFFVPFIIVTSFAVLNLFIGIIVDSMQSAHRQEEAETGVVSAESLEIRRLESKVEDLQGQIAALTALIEQRLPRPETPFERHRRGGTA
ncbi:MAG: ion transporter [Alphaproteobacteria bacterium]|nr:ion transporter [Alphaproteobacteria bacterium]